MFARTLLTYIFIFIFQKKVGSLSSENRFFYLNKKKKMKNLNDREKKSSIYSGRSGMIHVHIIDVDDMTSAASLFAVAGTLQSNGAKIKEKK